MGPNHWTAVLTVLDTDWVPSGAFADVTATSVYGIPLLLVESPDLGVMALAQQQPGFLEVGPRSQINMNYFDCRDQGRVGVRHEHLEALAAAGTLAEFQAARAAIQADTSYPPAP